MEKPSLNQISSLIEILQANENISKHFILEFDDMWDKLIEISLKQYRYILYLLCNRKYAKLNQVLTNLNFKQYENSRIN